MVVAIGNAERSRNQYWRTVIKRRPKVSVIPLHAHRPVSQSRLAQAPLACAYLKEPARIRSRVTHIGFRSGMSSVQQTSSTVVDASTALQMCLCSLITYVEITYDRAVPSSELAGSANCRPPAVPAHERSSAIISGARRHCAEAGIV
jgi:hypothetical protein